MIGILVFILGGIVAIVWVLYLIGLSTIGGDELFLDLRRQALTYFLVYISAYLITLAFYIRHKKRSDAKTDETTEDRP